MPEVTASSEKISILSFRESDRKAIRSFVLPKFHIPNISNLY